MTECNQSSFGFEGWGWREIVARFDGGTISSDGGALLLRQADQRLDLLPRLAECFLDGRNQSLVEHSGRRCSRKGSTVWRWDTKIQRSRTTAGRPGFRHPGRQEGSGGAAGRQEHAEPDGTGYGYERPVQEDHFLEGGHRRTAGELFIESHPEAPAEIVLDMDTTDMPLHGKQEGRFFHGLLRQLLLPAALRLLRRSRSVRAHARSQP